MNRVLIVFLSYFIISLAFAQDPDLKLEIFKLKHGNAQSIYEIANDMKSEQGRVSFDPNTGSLVVLDYPHNLNQIGQVINSLDIAAKNIEIKVKVCDVSGNFLSRLGLYSGQVIIPSGQFQAVLEALESDQNSEIRSEMTLRTLSNHPARLQVSKDEIFGHTVTHYSTRHNDYTVVTALQEPIGDFMEVLPTANNDGTITVAIHPTMSTFEQGSAYERTILTQVVVNSGDTVALGGLESSAAVTQRTESSFLGIPFSRTTTQKDKSVVMLLTATILD
ncbi:MAG: hypothetical protein JW867_04500 [Candidatus Omnitrophica bacterium]|nr:hypothetical protein [Candidatus Omnitrophota bacterium]